MFCFLSFLFRSLCCLFFSPPLPFPFPFAAFFLICERHIYKLNQVSSPKAWMMRLGLGPPHLVLSALHTFPVFLSRLVIENSCFSCAPNDSDLRGENLRTDATPEASKPKASCFTGGPCSLGLSLHKLAWLFSSFLPLDPFGLSLHVLPPVPRFGASGASVPRRSSRQGSVAPGLPAPPTRPRNRPAAILSQGSVFRNVTLAILSDLFQRLMEGLHLENAQKKN